ncbi:condensation domain-containing protein [Streptomyces sp. NPDC002773]|uniref:condensation domain-containing protein n=1 Tax=Streptomyces sp. NPDC002773 TaxID=3154430 RepID=UPI003332C129
MRITDIQACEVRPGRLVEWTLSPAAVKAAARTEDARPPAYIQEMHIRRAKRLRDKGLFVPTWIGIVFDMDGPVDLDVLQEALRAWTARHETLRSGFRWAGESGDELRRFTLDAGEVALHREDAGDFPDGGRLSRHLENRFHTVADALRWPNLIYAAVLRDDSTSVYMAFDHSNVDAYSLFRLPADVHELYTAGLEGRSPQEPAPVASYVDFCELERADADRVDDGHPAVSHWREFIRRCGGQLPGFPLDLGLTAGAPPARQRVLCEPLAGPSEAAAFEAYCRPYGGSLAGVLAATARIVGELGGPQVYRTVVPFHTRTKSRWSESVGWYVGGVPIEVETDLCRSFPDALRTVRAELKAHRALAGVPMNRVLNLLGADRSTDPDLFSSVSYIDTRAIPGADRWSEQRAHGLIRPSHSDQVFMWANRLPDGIWLTSRFPDTDVADKVMRLYTERLRDHITSTL